MSDVLMTVLLWLGAAVLIGLAGGLLLGFIAACLDEWL